MKYPSHIVNMKSKLPKLLEKVEQMKKFNKEFLETRQSLDIIKMNHYV